MVRNDTSFTRPKPTLDFYLRKHALYPLSFSSEGFTRQLEPSEQSPSFSATGPVWFPA